jgi:predicted pyridoxine 5'-phosphate oxidase superfamily flavin-nucleotide-binding protein
MHSPHSPGSRGEHLMQERQGSVSRAQAFCQKQMLGRLNVPMQEFVREQTMFFLASAEVHGECDCSFRAGDKGFVLVLDERTLAYPEYRGNGVYASLGNISENGHVGLLFVDFFRHTIGLHVNGKASVRSTEEMARAHPLPPDPPAAAPGVGRRPELWVVVEVEEAYIHCSKHIPLLFRLPKETDWGTDDVRKKGGDYFGAKQCERPWTEAPADGAPAR